MNYNLHFWFNGINKGLTQRINGKMVSTNINNMSWWKGGFVLNLQQNITVFISL